MRRRHRPRPEPIASGVRGAKGFPKRQLFRSRLRRDWRKQLEQE